mgnify:CR=1 FL=1
MSVGNATQAIDFNRQDLTLVLGENLDLGGDGSRNGTGKTTLINTLAGATRQHAGSITLDGVPLHRLASHARAAAGIGWVPQERNIFKSLSVLTAANELVVQLCGLTHGKPVKVCR